MFLTEVADLHRNIYMICTIREIKIRIFIRNLNVSHRSPGLAQKYFMICTIRGLLYTLSCSVVFRKL